MDAGDAFAVGDIALLLQSFQVQHDPEMVHYCIYGILDIHGYR